MHFDPVEWNRLERAFIAWAASQPALRAAIAVGARERADPPPDEWSDLDWMLFLANRDDYAAQSKWLDSIGEVWVALLSHIPTGDPEWLVTYSGGYNVDFVLLDTGSLEWLARADPLPEPFARGYRVLVDKDGLAAQISPAAGKPPALALPTAEQFSQVVSAFWYTAYYIAKQLSRGELFVAKVRDGNLKEPIMQMLAWQSLATRGGSVDIWHMGRFIDRWADPQALAGLPATFAHYDAPDSWRALLASLALFRRLALETAARLGYTYPDQLDERMGGLVQGLTAERGFHV
jgi:aminoglycoside 6-adenylyltransferase